MGQVFKKDKLWCAEKWYKMYVTSSVPGSHNLQKKRGLRSFPPQRHLGKGPVDHIRCRGFSDTPDRLLIRTPK